MSVRFRHFGRTLPTPSTLQILHDLMVFSAAEDAKRQAAGERAAVDAANAAVAAGAPVQA